MRFIALNILLTFACISNAQHRNYSAFTTNDGLPSNHIYQCVEDDHGFLWVATDAGIARFDGKHFQVFTTEHGLPDNEVLQVVKDKTGTIWINCFKQSPAYFDETKNRFINAKEQADLGRVTGTANMQVYVDNEGVMYHNENGSHFFKNKKLQLVINNFLVRQTGDSTITTYSNWNSEMNQSQCILVFNYKKKATDSLRVITFNARATLHGKRNDVYYFFDGRERKAYMVSEVKINPLGCRLDSLIFPESYFTHYVLDRAFYVISNSAKIYLYDRNTLQLLNVISGDYLPNNYYIDSKGNQWICTIDKGLLVSRKESIAMVELPASFSRNNFLSIAKKADGSLLAGNYYGEIVELNHKRFTIHTVVNKKPCRQKKVIVVNNDVYSVSDAADGIFLNYTREILNPFFRTPVSFGGKTALLFNDSLLFVGTTYGIVRINTHTGKVTGITRYKRATALSKASPEEVYFGSTDGLYKFNITSNRFTPLAETNKLLSERITALCTTPDGFTWAGTSSKGIIVLNNNKVLHHITSVNGIISNSCKTLTTGRPGQVWLGTSQGISAIDYTSKNRKLGFTIKNLSINDGLCNNEVNEMIFSNDTMYAATGGGIAVIPVSTSMPEFDIPVKLVKMSINETDTIISSRYDLGYRQQNIRMQFAGIELNGHFKKLQYTLDKTDRWADIPNNTLTLQLNSGNHSLQLRAIDVNGNISRQKLTIHFSIATPFWKAAWFWIALGIVFQVFVIWIINKRQKRKKELKLAKEIAGVQTASLEQQAFTSLMNPHFMFNALNSIQHYINVQDRRGANRYLSDFASLIRKNFEAAHQSFISLEQELENIRIYLRLEQMRFADRFTYRIDIDESVDTDEWMIPTMMLQPLLENALLHGIMPSTTKGELLIELKEESNKLCINISDNGIGIENSKALKLQSNHKSHGTELISKRITALCRLVNEPITMTMKPAFDSTINPGNKITLIIPSELYNAWRKVRVLN